MGVKWDQLPESIRGNLEKALLSNILRMGEVELSCFLKGGAALDYRWHKKTQIKDLVFTSLFDRYGVKSKIRPELAREVGSMIYNMGEAGLKWNIDITDKMKTGIYNGIEKCAPSFDSQHISNTIYGFANSSSFKICFVTVIILFSFLKTRFHGIEMGTVA
jgi:hypothetical protein